MSIIDKLFHGFPNKIYQDMGVRRVQLEQKYILYPLSKLEQLVQADRQLFSSKEDQVDTFRYVVDMGFQLWLSHEGTPSYSVPGHGQMRNWCYAAGNIKVNKEGKIFEINHKSGDFSPAFSSLVWLFLIIYHAEAFKACLAEEISIEEIDSTGGHVAFTKLKKEALLQAVSAWENQYREELIEVDKRSQKSKLEQCRTQAQETETIESTAVSSAPPTQRPLKNRTASRSLFTSKASRSLFASFEAIDSPFSSEKAEKEEVAGKSFKRKKDTESEGNVSKKLKFTTDNSGSDDLADNAFSDWANSNSNWGI